MKKFTQKTITIRQSGETADREKSPEGADTLFHREKFG